MSFINPFQSSLKRGQSIVEFAVLAGAVVTAVAVGWNAFFNSINNAGQDFVNSATNTIDGAAAGGGG